MRDPCSWRQGLRAVAACCLVRVAAALSETPTEWQEPPAPSHSDPLPTLATSEAVVPVSEANANADADPGAGDTELALPTQVDEPWAGATHSDPIQILHGEYSRVFPGGNRNAASHRWSKFLIERSEQMGERAFVALFQGFCAISGSPISSGRADGTRYQLTLDTVSGAAQRTGYLHYCCWPCVCDTQDFVRLDTRSIRTKDGVKQYWWLVLGNPCKEASLIPYQAQQVTCDVDGNLEESLLSDHGYVIIGLFLDSRVGDAFGGDTLNSRGEAQFADQCEDRKAQGYNSGMTDIFRKVAAITPLVTRTAGGDVCAARALPAAELAAKRKQLLTGGVSAEVLAALKQRQAEERQGVRVHQLRMQELTGEAQCGTENGVCSCSGRVKFGFGERWSAYKQVDGEVACANSEFGDPAPGQGKVCICKAGPSVCYRSMSRGAVKLVAEEEGASVGSREGDDMSVEACKVVCSKNAACKSFAFCPSDNHGCFLKSRVLVGGEPTKRVGRTQDCETYFEVPCSGEDVAASGSNSRSSAPKPPPPPQQQRPSVVALGPCDDELDKKYGAGYCKERKALCPRDTNFQKVCRKTCEVCDKVPAPGAAAPPPEPPAQAVDVEPLIKGSTEVAVPRGGTAGARLHSAVTLTANAGLDGEWADVRRQLLMACGLRDLSDRTQVGRGFTGHCFADWNHVDCCTMVGRNAHNENDGRVGGMSFQNRLGAGITHSSEPTHGPGGSWCTCQVGAKTDRDVCHVQFNSSIAFKLVWCPQTSYQTFVLVNDDGKTLRRGRPRGAIPSLQQRVRNYDVVRGSKYARGCVPAPEEAAAPRGVVDQAERGNGTCVQVRLRGLTCTRCEFAVADVLRKMGGVDTVAVALDYATFDEGVATLQGKGLPTQGAMSARLAQHGPYSVLESQACGGAGNGGATVDGGMSAKASSV